MHQLDRMEEMLQQLVGAQPADDRMRRHEVSTLVVDMFAYMLAKHPKKIEAIKCYRSLTGHGLKESKDAIEAVTERLRPLRDDQ